MISNIPYTFMPCRRYGHAPRPRSPVWIYKGCDDFFLSPYRPRHIRVRTTTRVIGEDFPCRLRNAQLHKVSRCVTLCDILVVLECDVQPIYNFTVILCVCVCVCDHVFILSFGKNQMISIEQQPRHYWVFLPAPTPLQRCSLAAASNVLMFFRSIL